MQRPPPQASIPPAAKHKDTFQHERRTTHVRSCHRPELSSERPPGQRGLCSATKSPSLDIKSALLLTQPTPKGSSPPRHVLEGVFRGTHPTEDPSQRERALRLLGRAQRRPCPNAPSQTPGPRPHPDRAAPLPGGEGAAGEGRYLLGAACSMTSPPRPPGAADRAPGPAGPTQLPSGLSTT